MMLDAPPSIDSFRENVELIHHPEVKTQIEQMMRKHWEAWQDMELPMQGKTLRQAVRHKLGRQQVMALLEDAEKTFREGDSSLGGMENLQWVRRVLDLEKL